MGEPENQNLETLRLWGDGDEVDAVRSVEKRFGVKLDYSGAGDWFTAGDVYAELLRVLPEQTAQAPDTWAAFAEAICDPTGVDPLRVVPETRLIDRTGSWWLSLSVIAAVLLIGAAIVFWPF
jgi:hypothetical protein